VLIGLLQAQYCLSGYDASAHMSEETKGADLAGAWGMVGAVAVSILLGWLLLIALFLGIHDYEATVSTPTGFPITQILFDNFGRALTIFFMCLLLGACWFCGLASVTSNSRMIYAFSRDHAMVSEKFSFTKNIKRGEHLSIKERSIYRIIDIDEMLRGNLVFDRACFRRKANEKCPYIHTKIPHICNHNIFFVFLAWFSMVA
jgi:hypothetical protein